MGMVGPGGDEEELTVAHPERVDRHSCVVGSALAVHFAYHTQATTPLEHLTEHLLRRYQTLADRLLPNETALLLQGGAGRAYALEQLHTERQAALTRAGRRT